MIRSAFAALFFLAAFSATAHQHAASAAECKKMAGKKMMEACNTCVAQGGHHYHLGKMKGERCHDDAHDPMSK